MTRPKIIALGEVLWDLFPSGAKFGGAPANFACHAAILGGDVAIVSAVGDDERGREALHILRGCDVDVSLVQRFAEAPTGTVGVELSSDGKPSYTIHEGSAWDQIAWNAELESRMTGADAVYFGTLGQRSPASRQTIRRCLQAVRTANVPRVLDLNLRQPFYADAMIRDSIGLCSILKLNDEELPLAMQACGLAHDAHEESSAEKQLQQLRMTQNLQCVVMTCGASGAMLASAEGITSQPGIPTKVVDTVGAGDSFTAAFLLGLLQGAPAAENLRNACQVAANVCAHAGAVPSR